MVRLLKPLERRKALGLRGEILAFVKKFRRDSQLGQDAKGSRRIFAPAGGKGPSNCRGVRVAHRPDLHTEAASSAPRRFANFKTEESFGCRKNPRPRR
jgi:hypothetical protein